MAVALAAPIAAATGLSIGTATTLATGALYLATTAASIFLQMAMAEKPQQEIGTKLDAVLGGAVNQAFHIGRKETAGSFIYKGSWGKSGGVPNAFLVKVYCLSDRDVEGFEDYVWVDGIKCNYDPGDTTIIDGNNIGHPINKWDTGGGHRLWVKFHDGSQGTADDYLMDKFGTGPRAWTADHIGRGRAYIVVTQKYDKKNPTGEAEVIPVVKNVRLYDFRNDSTNGGVGAQRYDDSSTWGLEPGNPVTATYHLMRGLYRGNEWIYGGQAWPATRFDNATWTAAANKCDTDINVSGGGTIKFARVGAEIDVSEEPWTVIERMLRACNGRIVESGGKFKIYVGGIGASVYSFTDDNIILSEELTGKMFPTRDQIANTVNGTYVEPDNAGEAKAYKPRTKTEYVEEDGDIRKTTLDFEYVRDNRQAQRLATLALKDNRRFRVFSLAFWSQARMLEPCDVISWTSDRYQFTAKKFIVGDVVLRDDGIVMANLREADASDADWNPLTDEDPFETGVFEDLDEESQILTATVTAVPFTDDAGKDRRPAIRIQATLDDDFVDCEALRVQVRKQGDHKVIYRHRFKGFFEPDSEDYGDITFTSESIATLKANWVEVRFKIDPESDRETTWSEWTDHAINLNDIGIDDDDTSDDLLAAPTSLSVTKVQDKDEDGTIRTFLRLDCVPAAWAGDKAEHIYEVEVASDDTYRIKSKSAKARFRVNRTNRLHTVRARMRNGVGQLSAWTGAVSLTPSKKGPDAAAITGITINRKNGVITVKWDRISDPDNREVVVMRGTTNVLASMTEVGRTKSTKWRDDDNITKGVRYYYRLLPVDTSDNVGAAASAPVDEVETGIGTSDTDATALAAPTGISIFQANRDVDQDGKVDIAMRTTFSGGVAGAAGYEVWWEDSAGQTATARADSGSWWFIANTVRTYRARWRTINWVGTAGAWSSFTSFVAPAPTAGSPAAPSGFTVNFGTHQMSYFFNTPTENDYSFTEMALRFSAGTPTTSDNKFTVQAPRGYFYRPKAGGAINYLYARHVNTSGLASSWVLASGSPGDTDGIIYLAANAVDRAALDAGAAGATASTNLGTSLGGSVNAGSGTSTVLTLTWKCTSNTAGVTVTLGSKSQTFDFIDQLPLSMSSRESGGGSFSSSKSGGGTVAGAELIAETIY